MFPATVYNILDAQIEISYINNEWMNEQMKDEFETSPQVAH